MEIFLSVAALYGGKIFTSAPLASVKNGCRQKQRKAGAPDGKGCLAGRNLPLPVFLYAGHGRRIFPFAGFYEFLWEKGRKLWDFSL